jgi:methionine-rich copper-binding protein CopC
MKIATLVDEELTAGEYEVEFNTSSIKHHPSSGIYFYQLKAGDFIQTKKMVLFKMRSK